VGARRARQAVVAIALVAGCGESPSWQRLDIGALHGIDVVEVSHRGESMWVVGQRDGATPVVHFDGTSWRELAAPPIAAHAIWASGESDVYAAGDGLVRWEGAGWTAVDLGSAEVTDVWGSAPDDVWAITTVPPAPGPYFPSHLFHFDGASWAEIPGGLADLEFANPDEETSFALQEGCASNSADVWISAHLGWSLADEGDVFHWDGATWAAVHPGAAWTSESGDVLDLACAGGEAWTIAWDYYGEPPHQVLRSDGGAWTPMPSPDAVLDVVWGTRNGVGWAIGTDADVPQVWRLADGVATPTLGDDAMDGLRAGVTTDSGRTFMFGDDGVVLEYAP
jgi:hypothetical protein